MKRGQQWPRCPFLDVPELPPSDMITFAAKRVAECNFLILRESYGLLKILSLPKKEKQINDII